MMTYNYARKEEKRVDILCANMISANDSSCTNVFLVNMDTFISHALCFGANWKDLTHSMAHWSVDGLIMGSKKT